jgi:hypothetical protein
MDVWTKGPDGMTNVQGRVWPEDPVYFPDYSNPVTKVSKGKTLFIVFFK